MRYTKGLAVKSERRQQGREDAQLLRKKAAAFTNLTGFAGALCVLIHLQTSGSRPFSLESFGWVLVTMVMGLNAVYFFYSWHRQIQHMVQEHSRDPVTGGWSRIYFDDKLQKEVSRAGRYHYPLTLCMLDLDHFKSFNEGFGARRGDDLLLGFSRFVQGSIRSTDVLARYDGDTFCLLLPHTDVVRSQKVMARLLERCVSDMDCSFGAGITGYGVGESPTEFFLRAKAALEQAKRKGGKCIQCLIGGANHTTLEIS